MTKRIRPRVVALCVGVSVVLPSAGASAEAAKKPITGKLSQPGYTVFALAQDGSASSAPAKPGFKLTPPAKSVTLHLRGPDGEYAGPIVVGRKGKKAIVGVKAGAKLRKVRVRDGYAKVAKKVPKKSLDKQAKALADNKVPIGAGNFGHVHSKKAKGGAPGDLDLDGIPDPLDVDDDGDLILDQFDRSAAGGASHSQAGGNPRATGAISALQLDRQDTVNANAPGLAPGQVEGVLQSFGILVLGSLDVPADPGTDVELDCGGEADPVNPAGWIGGLSFCTRGGTGTLGSFPPLNPPPGASTGDPFPECCDSGPGDPPGGDGLGSLYGNTPPGATTLYVVALRHGATRDEVSPDKLLTVRFTAGGAPAAYAGTLSDVFLTVPALASYTAESEDPTPVSYPVAPGEAGTRENPFTVTDGDGDSDVEVTLTFWRPQRAPFPNESGQWIDVGHAVYWAGVTTAFATPPGASGGAGGMPGCPEAAYPGYPGLSPVHDPGLAGPGSGTNFGLEDSSDDQAPDPFRTLSFTLNLTTCLAAQGASFGSGDTVGVGLQAQPSNPPLNAPSHARSVVWFKRP